MSKISSEYTEGELRRDISSEVHRSMRFWTYIHRSICLYKTFGIYRGTSSSEYTEGHLSSEYTEGHVPRNIPRDLFLGIFRGFISSEIPDENSEEHFVGTSEVNSEEVLPRYIPRSFPTNWWSSEFPRKFVSSEFRRKIPRDFRGK